VRLKFAKDVHCFTQKRKGKSPASAAAYATKTPLSHSFVVLFAKTSSLQRWAIHIQLNGFTEKMLRYLLWHGLCSLPTEKGLR
jgi:hypothetical protein